MLVEVIFEEPAELELVALQRSGIGFRQIRQELISARRRRRL